MQHCCTYFTFVFFYEKYRYCCSCVNGYTGLGIDGLQCFRVSRSNTIKFREASDTDYAGYSANLKAGYRIFGCFFYLKQNILAKKHLYIFHKLIVFSKKLMYICASLIKLFAILSLVTYRRTQRATQHIYAVRKNYRSQLDACCYWLENKLLSTFNVRSFFSVAPLFPLIQNCMNLLIFINEVTRSFTVHNFLLHIK